eukprot:NODE_793_length_3856_cov_0.643865.p2 type:complete len:263 gc:universal NODE_793_length_3856_cov_0.643865:2487-3275(+)
MHPKLLILCRQLLVQVVRTFYDKNQHIIIDYLMINNSATETALASLFGVHLRQLNAICYPLKNDKIIRQIVKKQVAGNEFDIDYVALILITKYKILQTRIAVENKIESAKELQGYICPNCGKQYGALDVAEVLNIHTNLLQCEFCDIELQQNVKNQVSDEKLTELMKQIAHIVTTLREIDTMEIPEIWFSTSVVEDTSEKQQIVVELADEGAVQNRTTTPGQIDHAVPKWHQESTVKRPISESEQPNKVLIISDSDDEFEDV